MAYPNIESKIKINGFLSDPLTSMCVRQWCLLSILLHNIAGEVLANLINADKKIKWIQAEDHEIKILNLSDNTTIFLRDITWRTSKKYVHSRFPSFEPTLPPCSILSHAHPPPSPIPKGTFVLVRIHPPPQFLYLWNLEKRN